MEVDFIQILNENSRSRGYIEKVENRENPIAATIAHIPPSNQKAEIKHADFTIVNGLGHLYLCFFLDGRYVQYLLDPLKWAVKQDLTPTGV